MRLTVSLSLRRSLFSERDFGEPPEAQNSHAECPDRALMVEDIDGAQFTLVVVWTVRQEMLIL